MFDFRNIPPEDARKLYAAHFWDDATMTQWINVRTGGTVEPERVAEMLAMMCDQNAHNGA